MNSALKPWVFDQALSEAGSLQRFAEGLAARRKQFARLGFAARSLGLHARLIGSLARHWDPAVFQTTAEVWDATDKIEPYFFALYAFIRTVKRSNSETADLPHHSLLGDEISLRLNYADLLRAELPASQKLSVRQQRQQDQALLDSYSVPPEVRYILLQARSIPVLIFLAYLTKLNKGLPEPFSARLKEGEELLDDTLVEGLDSVIGLMLGLCHHYGTQTPAPPSGLEPISFAAMDVQAVEKRWQMVQSAWSS